MAIKDKNYDKLVDEVTIIINNPASQLADLKEVSLKENFYQFDLINNLSVPLIFDALINNKFDFIEFMLKKNKKLALTEHKNKKFIFTAFYFYFNADSKIFANQPLIKNPNNLINLEKNIIQMLTFCNPFKITDQYNNSLFDFYLYLRNAYKKDNLNLWNKMLFHVNKNYFEKYKNNKNLTNQEVAILEKNVINKTIKKQNSIKNNFKI